MTEEEQKWRDVALKMTRQQREKATGFLLDKFTHDGLATMSDESVIAALEGLHLAAQIRADNIYALIKEIGEGR